MEKGKLYDRMEGIILESTLMIKSMDGAFFHGMMVDSILVSGVMANSMELEFMLIIMECREKGNGSKANGFNGSVRLKNLKIAKIVKLVEIF